MTDKEFQEYKEELKNKNFCVKCLKELTNNSLDNFCDENCSKNYYDEIRNDGYSVEDYLVN